MDDVSALLGRERSLFSEDLDRWEGHLSDSVENASFLVLGGAGSIGHRVVHELFRRKPRRLHVVDLSENNLVELVRDLRSSLGYIPGDFRTLPLDVGGEEHEAFLDSQPPYDYVLNLSALKHVRSEKDPYTLMRMIRVNVANTEKSLRHAIRTGSRKYFAVSTDKAVFPANMMGATKGAMELCLMRASLQIPVSTARFANVAFSDGSLLHGFRKRFEKRQPLAAPRNVRRFFITEEEAGQLCVMAALLGNNREVFFPKEGEQMRALDFPTLAARFLEARGYTPVPIADEEEARARAGDLIVRKQWPCCFSDSRTTGEKEVEEFHAPYETVLLDRFAAIGVVQRPEPPNGQGLDAFLGTVDGLRRAGNWTREDLIRSLETLLPDFRHLESNKFLDDMM